MSQESIKKYIDVLPQKNIILQKDAGYNKAHKIRVLTCNLRGAFSFDGTNAWENRCHFCLEEIKRINPDLIASQEMVQDNFNFLVPNLQDYRILYTLDQVQGGRPMNTIMYRKERFKLLSSGAYFLSVTPHVIGSKSWDSRHRRLVNWAQLEDTLTGKVLFFMNTHLDNIGQEARENSARMICESAKACDAYPQILAGDMNCTYQNPTIQYLLGHGWTDTYAVATGIKNEKFTYHAFLGDKYQPETDELKNKIDWIFTRGNLRAIESSIVRNKNDLGHYPSDHYFVYADIVDKTTTER